MAFNADDRVIVTAQSLEQRGKLGTVEVPAASAADGFNKVRLDGMPVGKTFNFSDKQLATTNFTSPVQY